MKNLKTIELSGTVKEIGSFAFAYSGLQSVGIEYGVETLGSYAFYECDDLETVVIPQSVTSIGDQAFARSGLQSVYDLAMTPQAFSTNMFGGASDSYPIYVPEASVTAYKAKWPNYADRIQGGKVDVNFEGYGDEVVPPENGLREDYELIVIALSNEKGIVEVKQYIDSMGAGNHRIIYR